jgi:hypothetical protein
MSRALPIMMLVAGTAMAWLILATTGPAIADMCDGGQTLCNDSCIWDACASSGAETHQACVSQCLADCQTDYEKCRVGHPKTGSVGNYEPPTYPTNPPPKIIGQPPNSVGVEQPPGGTPPPKPVLPPPANVGGNQPPGATPTPPGPVGVHPVLPVNPNPVGVNPGTGNPTGTTGSPSGETIYAVKPPEVKTSPIGITTTTVYDPKGNSTATLTDRTGKVLEKIITFRDPNGDSRRTTTDANGKVLNIAVTKSDGTSTLYNSAGKIVSQSKKITTTGTDGTYVTSKGHKESFMGQTSQKHKEKGMNEFFHEEKHNVNQQNLGATPSSHAHGGHR